MVCKGCKKRRKIKFFSKDSSKKNGYKSKCKTCCLEQYRKWYSENQEYVRKKGLDHYYDNKEYYLEYAKSYKERNKERLSKIQSDYWKEYCRRDYVKEKNRIFKHEKKARIKNVSDGSVNKYSIKVIEILQDFKCNHCHISFHGLVDKNGRSGKHLDHITPISIGGIHSMSNLQWLCWKCNLIKGDRFIG